MKKLSTRRSRRKHEGREGGVEAPFGRPCGERQEPLHRGHRGAQRTQRKPKRSDAKDAKRIDCGLLLIASLLVSCPASADRMISFGFAASNPRGDFATGWSEGVGFDAGLQWSYWKSIDASVDLSFLNHQPKVDDDPEVLLGVWTLGVHWVPQISSSTNLDFLFGAQHHTALFHTGWDKYVGSKGYNESDLGACFGIALSRRLFGRWRFRLGARTNTIFTEPEWVRYETVSVGFIRE